MARISNPIRLVCALLLGLVCAPEPVSAQGVAAPFFRVFLEDGSTLSSFGEWARVGDQMVFSMPLAASSESSDLHLVSMPVARIDLQRTERYAEAVRAAQYAATRGEADFAALSAAVAQTLNQVSQLSDPKDRLATAEQARRTLAAWPGRHHGYRASEVADILGVLDEVIIGLRAQAGDRQFALALAATTAPAAPEPLLPAPTAEEVVKGLITASELTASATERISLLQALVTALDRAAAFLPDAFAAAFRSLALSRLDEERRVDAAYAQLSKQTMTEAGRHVERANVRGLEQVRDRLRVEDSRLGARRPDTVAGVMVSLDEQLTAAHRRRLALDQWVLTEAELREYQSALQSHLRTAASLRPLFTDIRMLAGPEPEQLLPLSRATERLSRMVALITAPASAANIHAALRSALSLAENAVQLRRDAVQAADVDLARRASAAASGALLLFDRVQADLKTALQPPATILVR